MYAVYSRGELVARFFNESIANRVADAMNGEVHEVCVPSNWWEPSWEDAPTNLTEPMEDVEVPFE